MSQHPGYVETVTGHKDFLTEVGLEIFGEHGEATELPESVRKGLPVDHGLVEVNARPVAAESVACTTSVLPATGNSVQLVRERNSRRRLIVANWGPEIVYVAGDSGISTGSPNAAQIPVGVLREFRTQAALWAAGTNGSSPTVDVVDEYD